MFTLSMSHSDEQISQLEIDPTLANGCADDKGEDSSRKGSHDRS